MVVRFAFGTFEVWSFLPSNLPSKALLNYLYRRIRDARAN
jgi:hypothetical protein